MVQQPDVAAGDVEALLDNLGLSEDARDPQRFSVVVCLPGCQRDRDHRVKVVLRTSVDLAIKFRNLFGGNCKILEKSFCWNLLEHGPPGRLV